MRGCRTWPTARRGVDSPDGVEILGFPMVNSPDIELAVSHLPNANTTVFTSTGYYRVVEGTSCGVCR